MFYPSLKADIKEGHCYLILIIQTVKIVFMKIKVPFYPQKWDLSRWQKLGFESYQDAEYWEKSSCGILCLKMAIDSFLIAKSEPLSPSISDYIKKGVEIDAYKDSVGWDHAGLANLSKEFGFLAIVCGGMGVDEIREALKNNFLPIISIKWAFRDNKSLKEKILFWRKYGGHLALVAGYKEVGGLVEGFYIHHTSIIPEYNWQYEYVPLKKFELGFTGRSIIVKP
jgi:hypothetical protein